MGSDLVANVGYFMQFGHLVPVSLYVVFLLNKTSVFQKKKKKVN